MEIIGGRGFGLGSGRGLIVRWCMDWRTVHALCHGQ